jgi:hypothetical protein
MRPGDLVLCRYTFTRPPHLGVIVYVDPNIARDTQFYEVLTPGGRIKLMSENFLEEIKCDES